MSVFAPWHSYTAQIGAQCISMCKKCVLCKRLDMYVHVRRCVPFRHWIRWQPLFSDKRVGGNLVCSTFTSFANFDEWGSSDGRKQNAHRTPHCLTAKNNAWRHVCVHEIYSYIRRPFKSRVSASVVNCWCVTWLYNHVQFIDCVCGGLLGSWLSPCLHLL